MQIYNKDTTLTNKGKVNPLDTNRELVRPEHKKQYQKTLKINFRILIYQMRKMAKNNYTLHESLKREVSNKIPAISYCGSPTTRNVKIVKANGGKIMYKGLASCSMIWRCPICSFKILKGRAKEIYGITSRHLRTKKTNGFVTITIKHNRKDSLESTLNKVTNSYRKFQNLKFFRKLKKSGIYLGQIKSLELTHTYKNGWHPHLHIIYFWNTKDKNEVEIIQNQIINQWSNYIKGSIKAQNQSIVSTEKQITEYVTKWDIIQELTNDFAKKSHGFKPMQLLAMQVTKELLYNHTNQKKSDNHIKALWLEYIEATKGKHRIHISRNLNKIYKVEKKTDEQLTKEINIEDLIISFCQHTWKIITQNELEPHLINICYEHKEKKQKQQKEVYKLLQQFEYIKNNITEKGEMYISLNQNN